MEGEGPVGVVVGEHLLPAALAGREVVVGGAGRRLPEEELAAAPEVDEACDPAAPPRHEARARAAVVEDEIVHAGARRAVV